MSLLVNEELYQLRPGARATEQEHKQTVEKFNTPTTPNMINSTAV